MPQGHENQWAHSANAGDAQAVSDKQINMVFIKKTPFLGSAVIAPQCLRGGHRHKAAISSQQWQAR
jgi:hypothetical protein